MGLRFHGRKRRVYIVQFANSVFSMISCFLLLAMNSLHIVTGKNIGMHRNIVKHNRNKLWMNGKKDQSERNYDSRF